MRQNVTRLIWRRKNDGGLLKEPIWGMKNVVNIDGLTTFTSPSFPESHSAYFKMFFPFVEHADPTDVLPLRCYGRSLPLHLCFHFLCWVGFYIHSNRWRYEVISFLLQLPCRGRKKNRWTQALPVYETSIRVLEPEWSQPERARENRLRKVHLSRPSEASRQGLQRLLVNLDDL